MEFEPGQLVLVKTEFEATQVPLDYSNELRLALDKRKTLRRIKIKKNQILLVVFIPQDTSHFFPGWSSTVIARRVVFLLGNKLCMFTSVNDWVDYLGLINYDISR